MSKSFINKIILIVILLGLLVLGLVIFHNYFKKQNTPEPVSVSIPVLLNDDVYPLYSGVSWSVATSTVEEDLIGYSVSAQAANNISNIAEVSTPFEKYYSEKLKALGWSVDNSRAAGGPGSDIVVYKNGGEYVVISFDTDFKGTKPNEPVQCPCDVIFSVFSGVLQKK